MHPKISQYLYDNPQLLRQLSRFESWILRDRLRRQTITAPIYITGLARSGTTMMLEFLARCCECATHRYADVPFMATPYFGHILTQNHPGKLRPRSHEDGMMVNAHSPESMEEMLWAYFDTEFILEHIKKLLIARKASRYLAKANYHLPRISTLQAMFEDVRIVVMQRQQDAWIESCMRQDALFCAKQRKYPSMLAYTDLTRHFEFGLHKKVIDFGDAAIAQQISQLMASSEYDTQREGWVLYWKQAQTWINKQQGVLVVPYEAFCCHPQEWLGRVLAYCGLEMGEAAIEACVAAVRAPR